MNFKQHAIAGLAASAAVASGAMILTKNPYVSITFAIATMAGSIIPDVDTGSIPSRIFAWIGIIVAGILMYKGLNRNAAIVGVLYMAFSSDKHRGFTHGWLLIIVCFVFGYLGGMGKIQPYFVLLAPFAFGLCCHKLLDKD